MVLAGLRKPNAAWLPPSVGEGLGNHIELKAVTSVPELVLIGV